MPRMDGTGPEGKGSGTDRGQGRCRKNPGNDDNARTGKGIGRRRQSGASGGKGRGMQQGAQK